MSKKSTARTGSEGDADSTLTDVFAGVGSESSSPKSKRELEGGPFGDSPCLRGQQFIKDYFILMFQDDDTTTEASEANSDEDQELYDLKNDYLEKLNSVRRTLNLLELTDDLDDSTPISATERCTITEIVETDSNKSTSKREEEIVEPIANNEEVSDKDHNSGKAYSDTNEQDIITIYPSTKSLNFNKASAESIFELEYNPPKKKVCQRQKTPKLTSLSDGSLPYYTRVGLRDDLFIAERRFEANEELGWGDSNKLIHTKETQYTEEDIKIFKAKHKADIFTFKEPSNVDLYPEVIIAHQTRNLSDSSSCSSETSHTSKTVILNSKESLKDFEENPILSLNAVTENSDDSFTTTTYSTIIDSPKRKSKSRLRIGRKNKVSSCEKLTLWQELKKLYPSRTSNAKDKSEKDPADQSEENNDYIQQYLRYKRHISSVRRRCVPFGTSVAESNAEFQKLPEHLCDSEISSNEDKKKNDTVFRNPERDEKFWDKFCYCCFLKRN